MAADEDADPAVDESGDAKVGGTPEYLESGGFMRICAIAVWVGIARMATQSMFQAR